MNVSPIKQNLQISNNQLMKQNAVSFTAVPKIKPSMISRSNALLVGAKKKINYAKNVLYDDIIAKKFIAPIVNKSGKFIDWAGGIENMPSHTATLGAIVTTSVYANRTLHNDKLDKKRARTLALNQILVTGVSTVMGYTVNKSLGKMSKNLGYLFREVNQACPKLSGRMIGFDAVKQLAIFTLMNRYVAPVIVTPIASKLGKLLDKDNMLTAEEKNANKNVVKPQLSADLLKVSQNNIAKK